MPNQFGYGPYVPQIFDSGPGVRTLADLILRAGQQRADAQRYSGQLWGNTLANLGDTVAKTIIAIPAAKRQEALTKLDEQRAERERIMNERADRLERRQIQGEDLTARALGAPSPDITGPPTEAQQAAQGGQQNVVQARSVTPEQVSAALTQAGRPDLIPGAISNLKAASDYSNSLRQATVDKLAHTAKSILPMLDTPLAPHALKFAEEDLISAGLPENVVRGEIARMGQALQNDPASLKPMLEHYIRQSKTVSDEWAKENEVKFAPPGSQPYVGGKPSGAAVPKETHLELKETSTGLRPWNPSTGQFVGEAIAQPKPPAALLVQNAGSGLSDAALAQQAESVYTTGKMPQGMNARSGAGMAQRTAILNKIAELHPDFNAGAAQAAFEANKKSLDKLQGQTDAVTAYENTATKNAAMFDDILSRMPDAGVKFLNAPLRAAADQLGDEDQAAFNVLRQSLQTEYARAINNPNLTGVLSDSARTEIEKGLSANAPVSALRSALKTFQKETANRRVSYQDQIDTISARILGKKPPEKQPTSTEDLRKKYGY